MALSELKAMDSQARILASTASFAVLALSLLYLTYHVVLFAEQLFRTIG